MLLLVWTRTMYLAAQRHHTEHSILIVAIFCSSSSSTRARDVDPLLHVNFRHPTTSSSERDAGWESPRVSFSQRVVLESSARIVAGNKEVSPKGRDIDLYSKYESRTRVSTLVNLSTRSREWMILQDYLSTASGIIVQKLLYRRH